MTLTPGKPAVFLDRDGVINWDDGYTHRIEDLRILPGIPDELRRLRDLGFILVIVTNQAGIARGYYTPEEYQVFMAHLEAALAAQGACVDATYFCPHHPSGKLPQYSMACDCRKPNPGMLLAAMSEHAIDPFQSWLVGDKLSDVNAGVAAGIPVSQCLLVERNVGLAQIAGRIGGQHHGSSNQEDPGKAGG